MPPIRQQIRPAHHHMLPAAASKTIGRSAVPSRRDIHRLTISPAMNYHPIAWLRMACRFVNGSHLLSIRGARQNLRRHMHDFRRGGEIHAEERREKRRGCSWIDEPDGYASVRGEQRRIMARSFCAAMVE